MKQIRLPQSIAPFAAVAMMLIFAAFTGCEKKPEVYVSRADDPSYKAALQETRAGQDRQAGILARLDAQMQDLVARARAALPKGATDEQVRAELEGNPAKYPGWKALAAAHDKANATLEAEMAKARDTVRARILKEAADRKAIAEKRATAKKPVAQN